MKTLEALQKLDRETKAEVYLVGGYVRDLLRNKPNDDLDIVVKNYSVDDLVSFLRKYGKIKTINLSKTNERFGVSIILFRAFDDNLEAQIALPKRGRGQIPDPRNTLRQDVKHRDFTMNGMYLSINFKSKNEVIDHVGGRLSIFQRRIFAIGNPEERIKESPIRILRAISLSARTGYTIDKGLLQQMFNYSHLLMKIPPEIIREELNKILLSSKPSQHLKLMSSLGILELVIPELEHCRGVQQDHRYHKWDVFTHCILTCDNIDPRLDLRLAAVLHDVGKPRTLVANGQKVSFHKHEMASVHLAKAFLTRLGYANEVKKEVLHLIRMHMYHYTREFTDAAVRRFIDRAGVIKADLNRLEEFPLFKLRAAERLGNGLKTNPITEKQKDFQARIREVFLKGVVFGIKDLEINGSDIINTFKIQPSPQIGQILNYLLAKVLEDPSLNSKKELLKLTTEYLVDKKLI